MSKYLKCGNCVNYQTDACVYDNYTKETDNLCPWYAVDIDEVYEKGRADAIEEFGAECESASYIPIGYGYYVVDMKSVRKIAEMLKEQKNE